jgi:type VI secretion system Hcp family effector
MRLDGISGSSNVHGYENWIKLESVDFCGVNVHITSTPGRQTSRLCGQPSFGEFAILKIADASSVGLFEAVHSGKVLQEVEIDYVNSNNPPAAYIKYVLNNVIVTHYSNQDNGAGQLPIERIRLNYEKIQKTFIPKLANNSAGSPIVTGFDLSTMKKM